MQDLHYDTVVTERHSVRVKTWTEDGDVWVETHVDGRLMAHENIGPADDSISIVERIQ